ncbi:OstA-like protein [Blattabacterium cuenoti]|uniref:OstA-like protein n=1 Tax=Blattabacterium cuenoti TaxID=1653831 RepID=UPI001EEC1858|nr:OstA-like protein [Blattabacterium cuenoti]
MVHADYIQKNNHDESFILIGNIHIKYNKYHLFCDKAIYYKENNRFYGYGNVQLKSEKNKIISQKIYIEDHFYHFKLSGRVVLYLYEDKTKLMANVMNYNFRKKLLQAIDNVVLLKNNIKLTTNILEYNFKIKKIHYKGYGVIHYDDYTISSKEGFFLTEKNKAKLIDKIKLVSKNYIVYSDVLEFFLKKNQINFNHPTIVVQNTNSNNFLYTKKALFLIKKKIFFFNQNISIHYNGKIIRGKYLFFDQKKQNGFIKNVLLEDSKKKYFLMGEYGKFDFKHDFFILNKNIKIVKRSKENSIFIFSNILKIKKIKNSAFFIQAFTVKSFFLNGKIQGKCNVLNYDSSNNYIQFDGNTIFWYKNKQLSGNSIFIHFREGNEDSLKYIKIIKNAFYIEKINSLYFNQVEGEIMIGFFNKKNFLKKILIQGNTNSIIFLPFPSYKGIKLIHKFFCGTLSLNLDDLDNKKIKIKKILCTENAQSELIPISPITPKKFFFLSNFVWKEKEKPKMDYKKIDQKMEKYRKENMLEQEQILKIKK